MNSLNAQFNIRLFDTVSLITLCMLRLSLGVSVSDSTDLWFSTSADRFDKYAPIEYSREIQWLISGDVVPENIEIKIPQKLYDWGASFPSFVFWNDSDRSLSMNTTGIDFKKIGLYLGYYYQFAIPLPTTGRLHRPGVVVERILDNPILSRYVETRNLTIELVIPPGELNQYDQLSIWLGNTEGIDFTVVEATADSNSFSGSCINDDENECNDQFLYFYAWTPLSGVYTFDLKLDITCNTISRLANNAGLLYKPEVNVAWSTSAIDGNSVSTSLHQVFANGISSTITYPTTRLFDYTHSRNSTTLRLDSVALPINHPPRLDSIYLFFIKKQSPSSLVSYKFACYADGEGLLGGRITTPIKKVYNVTADGDDLDFERESLDLSDLSEFVPGTYLLEIWGTDMRVHTFSVDFVGTIPQEQPVMVSPLVNEFVSPNPSFEWHKPNASDVNFVRINVEQNNYSDSGIGTSENFTSFTPAKALSPGYVKYDLSFFNGSNSTIDSENKSIIGVNCMSGGVNSIYSHANVINRPEIKNVSSPYCNQDRHTYYLSDIKLEQEFTAEIDWHSKSGSQVRWFINDVLFRTTEVQGDNASFTLDVGSLSEGDKLDVQAIAKDGTESKKYTVNFDVIEPPVDIPNSLWTVNQISNQRLSYRTDKFSLRWPKFDAKLPDKDNVKNPNNKPGIQSIGTSSFDTIVEVSAEIVNKETNIECRIGLKSDKVGVEEWKDKTVQHGAYKLAGVDFSAQVWINVILTYEKGWLPGGGVGAEVKAEKDFGPMYWIPPIPIPLPLFFKGSISAMLNMNLDMTGFGDSDGLLVAGSLSPSAGLEVVIGCGLSDVAAAEGFLTGSTGLTAEYNSLQQYTINGHYLELTGGVRAYILWFKYENNLLHFKWPNDDKQMKLLMVPPLEVDDLEVMSRDYLTMNDYAQWHGVSHNQQNIWFQTTDSNSTDPAETTLQTNVFSLSNAQLAVSGNTQCLVWLYDEPSRDSLDRTVLVYSLNDGTGWTSPMAIDDDGTADALPDLSVDANGNFICSWSNASQRLPEGTNLTGIAESLDIQLAIFDMSTGIWTSENLTDTSGLDYLVQTTSGTDITAIWVHDDDSDMLAESDNVTNSIVMRMQNALGWMPQQIIANTNGLIKYIDIASDELGRYVVYCLDRDSNLLTDQDNDIYLISDMGQGWSAPIQLTDVADSQAHINDSLLELDHDTVADVNPQFVKISTGLMLLWARDGRIVCTKNFMVPFASINDVNDINEVVAQEGSSGQRDYVATVGPGDTISVLWNDPSEEGTDIYTVIYDPYLSSWSDIVQMTYSRDMERSIDAAYTDVDTLTLVYNKVRMLDANGLDAFGEVDLCTYDYKIGADFYIAEDSVELDPNDPNNYDAVKGDLAILSATIGNKGNVSAEDSILVSFYYGTTAASEYLIGHELIPAKDITKGSKVEVSFLWSLPDDISSLGVLVVIDLEQKLQDINRDNNSLYVDSFSY